jgi:hypothetical protein
MKHLCAGRTSIVRAMSGIELVDHTALLCVAMQNVHGTNDRKHWSLTSTLTPTRPGDGAAGAYHTILITHV